MRHIGKLYYVIIMVFFMILLVTTSCSSWQSQVVDCSKKMMAVGVPYKDAAKMCYNMYKEKK